MPKRRRRSARAWALRAVFACGIGLAAAAPAGAGERIPLADFFRAPELTRLALSPDGRWIGAIAPADDHQALAVIDTDSDGVVRLLSVPEPRLSPLFFGSGERRIAAFWWVNDDRLLLSVTRHGEHQSHLLLMGREGGTSHELHHRPTRAMLYHQPDDLLNLLPDDPRHVLLSFPHNRAREFLGADVSRLDVLRGQLEVVERPVPRVRRWFVDAGGAVRAGYGERDGAGFLRYREGAEGTFREITELGGVPLSPRTLRVLGVGSGPYLYVASRHAGDRFAVYVYDLAEGRFSLASFSHPRVDVVGPLVTDSAGAPIGVRFVDDAPRIHWFEDAWQRRQERVDAALPGRFNTIESWNGALTRFVVRSEDDRHPPVYWLWSEPAGELRELRRERPDLDPEALAELQPVEIEAPDGLRLPGYLARPPGSSGPIPFLVELRGGGWPRARRGFDPELQFLVSRGWGVLRLNGRGSAGYGLALEEAGDGAWGEVAPQDLALAARWLVERGDADPARICGLGRGYGGYAALMAQAESPELFRCSVSVSGVSDPEAFLAHRARLLDEEDWRRRLEGDASPPAAETRAAAIQGPVFLAHGELDLVVPPEQSDAMADALRRAGNEPTNLRFEHDGHRILREASRLELYGALERFLDGVAGSGPSAGASPRAVGGAP